MAIKAILFDKDGTLIDFDATWGRATFEVLNYLSGGDERQLKRLAEVTEYELETMKISHTSPLVGDSPMELAVLWADIIGRKSGLEFEMEIDNRFTEESLKQLTGFQTTEPALRQLKSEGYRLGIATNDAESTAVLHMEKLGWDRYFEVIYGYNSGHGPKPGPGMVIAFQKHCEVKPEQVAMIGDSLHDIEAGKSAGSLSIGVKTGPWSGRQFTKRADAIIEHVGELSQCLQQRSFVGGN